MVLFDKYPWMLLLSIWIQTPEYLGGVCKPTNKKVVCWFSFILEISWIFNFVWKWNISQNKSVQSHLYFTLLSKKDLFSKQNKTKDSRQGQWRTYPTGE